MSDGPGLRRSAVVALAWSLLQNWGGRAMAMIVFVLLARLLRPAEFGIAASAFLAMSFVALVAELGFGDAIVQRRDLTDADINLPFYVSLGLAVLLAAAAAAAARPITAVLGVPGLAPYLIGAVALTPLMTLAGFQEALYRRALRFRDLALRTLAGVAIGGVAGIVVALAGFGPWAIVAQFAAQTTTSILWLWRRSAWRPGRHLNRASFRAIAAFGSGVVGMRVVDFITVRSVDLVILAVYGPAALGLFSVASRLYQLLMQLFQASISSVGLSVLSRVAHDRARLAWLFERSSSISAMVGTPVFFALAALAPEVNAIMFGPRWAGAEQVMRPLLLVGGLHCVQFTLGAYLAALGRPRTLLWLMLLKAAIVLPPLLFVHTRSVAALAVLYAAALAAEAPFILGATLRALALPARTLIRPVGLPLLAAAIAWGATEALRRIVPLPAEPIARAILLGGGFLIALATGWLALVPRIVAANIAFVRQAFA